MVDDDAGNLVRHVLEPVENPFQVAVDLAADNIIHRIAVLGSLEQRLEPGMLVRTVGKTPVKTVEQFAEAMKKESSQSSVMLLVRTVQCKTCGGIGRVPAGPAASAPPPVPAAPPEMAGEMDRTAA